MVPVHKHSHATIAAVILLTTSLVPAIRTEDGMVLDDGLDSTLVRKSCCGGPEEEVAKKDLHAKGKCKDVQCELKPSNKNLATKPTPPHPERAAENPSLADAPPPQRAASNTTNMPDPCEVCIFNPSNLCLKEDGKCWSHPNAAACQNDGGAYCQLPTCPAGQIVVHGHCMEQLSTDADRWVRVHNIFRCMQGSPAVSWNAAAAANAQTYVNALTSLQHSASYEIPPPAGPAGENLAMGQFNLESATDAWYKEVSDCGWPGCRSSPVGAMVGHFTAVVWKGTSQIGCAKNSLNIYICRYLNKPPNFGGPLEYEANVVQPIKSFEKCVAELKGVD